MFKKLFSGENNVSKPTQKEPTVQNPDLELQFDQTSVKIRMFEEQFETKITNYTVIIDKLRQEAKEFMKQGKKKHAENRIKEIQVYEKYIIVAENQKQYFFKVRMQLDHGRDNKNATDVLTNAIRCLKSVNPDEMEEIFQDIQELQQEEEQINQGFAQFANKDVNEDELQNMMAELENEIQTENQCQQFKENQNQVQKINIHTHIRNEKFYNQKTNQQQVQQQRVFQQNQNAGLNNPINSQLQF